MFLSCKALSNVTNYMDRIDASIILFSANTFEKKQVGRILKKNRTIIKLPLARDGTYLIVAIIVMVNG